MKKNILKIGGMGNYTFQGANVYVLDKHIHVSVDKNVKCGINPYNTKIIDNFGNIRFDIIHYDGNNQLFILENYSKLLKDDGVMIISK